MNQKKKATINDVARLAEVSKKTVSRIINNEPNVKVETRARVQNIMKQLNYSPDPQARGLASRRSFLLALVYDNPNSSFVTEAMYGVLRGCRPKGFELILHPCNLGDNGFSDEIVRFVNRMKIDGIILLPPLSESEALIEKLKQTNCNYVRLLSISTDSPSNMIHFKDREAVGVIANHLAMLGHTNIGFIQGPEGYQSARERLEGFREALREEGIDLPDSCVAKGAYTFQSGADCAEWLLNFPTPPTAIFASNDEMAMGVIVAAEKMGLKIPADLSVVGFDDNPHASEIWPALTTVNHEVKLMGKLAAEKVIALCDGEDELAGEIQHEVIPRFVVRQSTAPPRKPPLA